LLVALFKYGLNGDDRLYSHPLIFIAAEEKNLQAVKVLIEKGADINKKNWKDELLLELNMAMDKCLQLKLFDSMAYNSAGMSYLQIRTSYNEGDDLPKEIERMTDVLVNE